MIIGVCHFPVASTQIYAFYTEEFITIRVYLASQSHALPSHVFFDADKKNERHSFLRKLPKFVETKNSQIVSCLNSSLKILIFHGMITYEEDDKYIWFASLAQALNILSIICN